jgi:hypothetical protein
MVMGNEGVIELGLIDVRTQPAKDQDTTVRFFRNQDGREILREDHLAFPPIQRFKLPAFPQEQNLFAEVAPSRFRHRKSDFFTLTDGEVIRKNLTVMRKPDQWAAQFVSWNLLPAGFLPLKDVLNNSQGIKVKQGKTFDKFTGETYDGVSEQKTILAKAALLNLFAKLSLEKEPVTEDDHPWFSFVRQIFVIDRERFIAAVDPQMGQIIRTIKDDIGKFEDYKHTPSDNHFKGVQAAVPDGFKVTKSQMFSIKSKESHGNIQLTIAPTKDPQGNEVTVLDVDIDENGDLIKHLLDVFKHKRTGGTHPFDIHEYLNLAHPNLVLGYELE